MLQRLLLSQHDKISRLMFHFLDVRTDVACVASDVKTSLRIVVVIIMIQNPEP